jgi:hypothetical protein
MNFFIARRGLAAAFMAGASLSASAQAPRRLSQPDSIPTELAMALISAGGLTGDPQLLVGEMPGALANRIYVPPSGRVLGSAFIGTSSVAIISVPEMPDVAMSTMKRELATRGWKVPPPPPNYGGGFRSASMMMSGNADPARLLLCGGDQQMLTGVATRRRGVTTDIVLRLSTAPPSGYSTCNPPRVPEGMMRSPYPTLYDPPNVSENSQLCGDIFGSNGTGTTVRTPMSAGALLDHFAKQLQDSGWHAPTDSATIVGRTWTRTDSTGAPVELTITVATAVRDPSCRTLNLNVKTLRKP